MAYTDRRGVPLKNSAGVFVPGGLSGNPLEDFANQAADALRKMGIQVPGGGGGGMSPEQQAAADKAKKASEEKASQLVPGVPNMYLAGAGVVAAALVYMNMKK